MATLPVWAVSDNVQYVNHSAQTFGEEQSCASAMQAVHSSARREGLSALNAENGIRLVSWNVQKGSNAGWLAELRDQGRGAQLVLLQEALLTDEMRQPQSGQVFWSFAPGYRTDEYRSGLLLLSQVAPVVVCRFQVTEPWLRSPKATGAALFSLQDSGGTLLVINVHSINFSWGLGEYRQQLVQISRLLQQVPGPAIVAGDFNTWREARFQLMTQLFEEQGMTAVTFEPDQRTQAFGYPLDHIWVRELSWHSGRAAAVTVSDHNPMAVTLELLAGNSNAAQ